LLANLLTCDLNKIVDRRSHVSRAQEAGGIRRSCRADPEQTCPGWKNLLPDPGCRQNLLPVKSDNRQGTVRL